jgi:hypothetical protein
VTRIAITGHRGLDARTSELVDGGIRAELTGLTDQELVGVSCLADGADQIFAKAVLDLGGKLEVVVPAREYRAGLPPETHNLYDELLATATKVHELDFTESTEDAHMAASVAILIDADRLFAVWDGQPARGYGGTADVVAYAKKQGTPVSVIWPDGATRS